MAYGRPIRRIVRGRGRLARALLAWATFMVLAFAAAGLAAPGAAADGVGLPMYPPDAAASSAAPSSASSVASYDQFLQLLSAGRVQSVVVSSGLLSATLGDGTQVQVARVPDPQLLDRLLAAHVTVWGDQPTSGLPAWAWLLVAVPVGLGLIAALVAAGRRGMTGARLQGSGSVDVEYKPEGTEASLRFTDVAGLARPKRELEDIVAFLRDPESFRAIGARVPKGILFEGPPGTGKTLLARALSGEAGARFFQAAGAAFNEIYVGVGPKRVRQLFAAARKAAPAIVFIDELDAVGSRQTGQAHAEDVRLVTQLLAEMDGFAPLSGVIVVGATNRVDALDPALLRPGRFDRVVSLEPPSRDERRAILELHMRGKPFAADVDPRDWADATVGLVGADLENMLNEAAIRAVRDGRHEISRDDLVEAYQRTVAGIPSDHRLDPEERRRVAYHEAGHAVCGHAAGQHVQYVSILPRSRSGGQTVVLPPERTLITREVAQGRLEMLLGGRAAELIAFGDASNGAAADLRTGTALAHQMVAEWGLGSHLSFQASGRSSDAVAQEVEGLLEQAQATALGLLRERRAGLDALADLLLQREVLTGEEVEACLEAVAGQPDLVAAGLA